MRAPFRSPVREPELAAFEERVLFDWMHFHATDRMLEDHAGDIVAKSLRGRLIAPSSLCESLGIERARLDALIAEGRDAALCRLIAHSIGLSPEALEAIAAGKWHPSPCRIPWIHALNLPYDDMHVNVHVLWDPSTLETVVFDSGGEPDPVLRACSERGLKVRRLLLTHEHRDHMEAAPELARAWGIRPGISSRAGIQGFETFEDGAEWRVGALAIRAVPTPGHAKGGTTFVVDGPGGRVAVVGDALFAGSAGGCHVGFSDALEVVRSRILSLGGDTVIAPGHGPLTTVREELEHNPFFAPGAACRR